MKGQFAQYMLDKKFEEAAELVYESVLSVHAPSDVNLTINIDRDKNIADLRLQMERCYAEIYQAYSQLSFDKLWEDVFNNPELTTKQNLKSNEGALSKAKLAYDKIINNILAKQFEQIYEMTAVTLNASLQGVIDAAAKL